MKPLNRLTVLKRVIRILLIILLFFSAILLACIGPIDDTPYQEQAYYQQTLSALDSLDNHISRPTVKDTVQAGWSRKNITPQEPLSLMGYGWKGEYERVHDSLHVRAVVFTQKESSVAWLTYELMVMYPDLTQAIRQAVDSAGLPVRDLYFSAVHTHNGFGEWARGLGGKLVAGGYNEKLVEGIVQQTLAAIKEAYALRQPVRIGYADYALPQLMGNRLLKGGAIDPYLRAITLKQDSGQTAMLCTYAAHATFLNSKRMDLSADYPAALVKVLEQDSRIDFAAYAAGAVGSHSPAKARNFSYEKMDAYAEDLAAPLLQGMEGVETDYATHLRYADVPLYLGAPQLKLFEVWRVRPWLFEAVFGKIHAQISGLSVGNILMVGVPADYSGMLYPKLRAQGKKLVVSSFNGSYIGYVIPDQYYHENHREARELNWFGPYTGSYVTEVMNRFIEIVVDEDN